MRIKLRNPILSLTEDDRYQEYLQDRLTGNNIIQVRSIIVEDSPLVRTAVVTRTYIKNPSEHRAAWLVAGAASVILSVVPPTLIHKIPALEFKIPNPMVLVNREPEIVTLDIPIPITRQVPTEVEVPVEVSKDFEIQSRNQSGEFQADPIAVEQTAQFIEQIVTDGGKIDSTEVRSSASDEWGPLSSSLGVTNQGNLNTAQERAEAVVSSMTLATSTRGNNLGQIQIISGEDLWTPQEIEDLQALSIGLGFDSAQNLFEAYKLDRNAVPTGLADYLDVKLGEKRGTNITINYTTSEMEKKTVLLVPDTRIVSIDIPVQPKHDPFDLRIFPILIPPLGRREEEREKNSSPKS